MTCPHTMKAQRGAITYCCDCGKTLGLGKPRAVHVVADEVDPWEPVERSSSRLREPALIAARARAKRATDRARPALKPGDRIARRLCGGATGTFTFTHWEGDWICGRTISDCAAINIFRVNGAPTTFDDPPASEASPC